jgi:hypothetical protein
VCIPYVTVFVSNNMIVFIVTGKPKGLGHLYDIIVIFFIYIMYMACHFDKIFESLNP